MKLNWYKCSQKKNSLSALYDLDSHRKHFTQKVASNETYQWFKIINFCPLNVRWILMILARSLWVIIRQLRLNKPYFLWNLFYQVSAQTFYITNLKPPNWWPILSLIKFLKWWHLNPRVIVKWKHTQWKKLVPITIKINHMVLQHILDHLNHPLQLPISLRMKRHAKCRIVAQILM